MRAATGVIGPKQRLFAGGRPALLEVSAEDSRERQGGLGRKHWAGSGGGRTGLGPSWVGPAGWRTPEGHVPSTRMESQLNIQQLRLINKRTCHAVAIKMWMRSYSLRLRRHFPTVVSACAITPRTGSVPYHGGTTQRTAPSRHLHLSRNFNYSYSTLDPSAFHHVLSSLHPPPHAFSPTPHPHSLLAPLLIPRVPGSDGSRDVRSYLRTTLERAGWEVEDDTSVARTPMGEEVEVVNVVATWPGRGWMEEEGVAVVLGAHYDSKILPTPRPFLGATDAATSVAILLHLARHLPPFLHLLQSPNRTTSRCAFHTSSTAPTAPPTVRLVFFDAEESVGPWSSTDGLYGSRALASRWHSEGFLHRIALLVVMDLLAARGEPDRVPCFEDGTWKAWEHLRSVERRVAKVRGNGDVQADRTRRRPFFFPSGSSYSVAGRPVEDDHLPFARLGVPCVHLCPEDFPRVWHTERDDAGAVDVDKCVAWAEIVGTWVVEALGVDVGEVMRV
ncbi:hypothetical protein M427DRAFT_28780 [Gonapodya prolifera JEL478]|uniref:Peptide hydrolase n=1 Tax=Gonapodya prolifera (strain JEL478) TaxID=1344416 RepID=A0A139AT55_GONPJ|nr:hypothetical protein M427DRAFT_28780 [Gonapodya prolifera JEL478]|eukprot:KXS19911.1 hypothetical protein M427DRAFT_28780 [Gonapodya prolifera JEL478]